MNCADHCWHNFVGIIHMVVPDGHVVQKCCRCEEMRDIHRDRAREEYFKNLHRPGHYNDGNGEIFR